MESPYLSGKISTNQVIVYATVRFDLATLKWRFQGVPSVKGLILQHCVALCRIGSGRVRYEYNSSVINSTIIAMVLLLFCKVMYYVTQSESKHIPRVTPQRREAGTVLVRSLSERGRGCRAVVDKTFPDLVHAPAVAVSTSRP